MSNVPPRRKPGRKIRRTRISTGDFPLSCGNTFSVKNVVSSLLINLFDLYGDKSLYFIALSEFVDFEVLRELTLKFVNSHAEFSCVCEGDETLSDVSDGDDIARLLRRKVGAPKAKKALKAIAAAALKNVRNGQHFFCSTVSAVSPIDKIADFFGLSEKDARVLAFLACWYKTQHFDSLCTDSAEGHERSEVMKFIAAGTGIEAHEAGSAMKVLKEKRITEGGRRHLPDLADEIEEFIFDYDGSDLAQKFSTALPLEKVFPVDSFEVDAKDAKIVSKLLDCGNAHILLHGKPGSGKTEFAKAIAVELGKKVFVPVRKDDKKSALSPMKINAATFAAKNGNGIALIDEADDFLETGSTSFFGIQSCNTEKGAVNSLLDESRAPVIWISNSISGIDESTRRRFAYTLEFSGVSDRQKRIVLETCLKDAGIETDLCRDIFPIVSRYALSPAGISLAVKNAKIVSEDAGIDFLENVRRIAQSHYSLITGRQSSEKILSPDECFDANLLNTNPPIEEITASLRRYGNASRKAGKSLPLAMLFSGEPGTGKTQLGRYIAGELEKEILIRRMSDIKSPYVGMTEKNIAAAFREAEREDKVLMIDEADTLFIDRASATRSWEASETNEILAQMEVFKGIFICTTNLLANLDAAAMRRFQWKVEFRPLTLDARTRIFKRYFPHAEIEETVLRQELSMLEGICPGDFKAVRERMRYDDEPAGEKILSALRGELFYKKRGFSGGGKIGFVSDD